MGPMQFRNLIWLLQSPFGVKQVVPRIKGMLSLQQAAVVVVVMVVVVVLVQ